MSKPVILTGLRTNAEYHLGNYLGALLPMVELQNNYIGEYQVNLFAPDLHSFTTEIDHSKLYMQTMENLKVFVAAGVPIANKDLYIYRQSYISAHSELAVILNNFAYFGEVRRMTQFKEKSKIYFIEDNINKVKDDAKKSYEKYIEETTFKDIAKRRNKLFQTLTIEQVKQISKEVADETFSIAFERLQFEWKKRQENKTTIGLFDYPVMMAADILLYGAKYVPVGDDQRQHLELTRDLAIRMNNKFGNLFTIPLPWKDQLEFIKLREGVRIRSLKNPTKKMSKSVSDPSGTIMLSDKPAAAMKKIKSAETDSIGSIHWDWENQPGITNLLQIYQLLSGKTKEFVIDEWEGNERYGDLKNAVAEQVAEFLGVFQGKLSNIDEGHLEKKLIDSEAKMNEVAGKTLLRVQQAVGLRAR